MRLNLYILQFYYEIFPPCVDFIPKRTTHYNILFQAHKIKRNRLSEIIDARKEPAQQFYQAETRFDLLSNANFAMTVILITSSLRLKQLVSVPSLDVSNK